jgi:pyruvate formate lyase activating enzyme
MDHNLHKKYTGVENELILSNLEYAVREFRHVIARYPYIPGYNDDQADDILRLISKLKIKELDILPYHELGIHKYHAIGREYTIPKSNKVDACKLQNVVDKGLKLGIDILIGG